MEKYKKQIIATLIFFFLINTAYYWEGMLGIFAMITFLLLAVCFLVLAVLLLRNFYLAIREKVKDKYRLFLIGLMTAVLALVFFFPHGMVNFEKFESDSVLIAEREGVANCMTTLKLRENNTYKRREVCFGVSETTGTYEIKGDTIFLESNSFGRGNGYYELALIEREGLKNGKYPGSLKFIDNSGKIVGILAIVKNELK